MELVNPTVQVSYNWRFFHVKKLKADYQYNADKIFVNIRLGPIKMAVFKYSHQIDFGKGLDIDDMTSHCKTMSSSWHW